MVALHRFDSSCDVGIVRRVVAVRYVALAVYDIKRVRRVAYVLQIGIHEVTMREAFLGCSLAQAALARLV